MAVTSRLAIGACVLMLLTVVSAAVSLSLGPVHVPVSHVASIMLSFFGLDVAGFGRTEQLVIEQVRLPLILVGASVGVALGVAGATRQGLFRNPMADPRHHRSVGRGSGERSRGHRTGMASLFFLALPLFAYRWC